MSTFRTQAEARIKELVNDGHTIQTQLPFYFRTKRVAPDSSKAFTPLPKNATPTDWRSTISALQEVVKAQKTNASEQSNALGELLRFVSRMVDETTEAWDIQGRVLLKICEKVGIDFDDLVADFVLAKDEKGVAFLMGESDTPKVETIVTEEEEGTAPF